MLSPAQRASRTSVTWAQVSCQPPTPEYLTQNLLVCGVHCAKAKRGTGSPSLLLLPLLALLTLSIRGPPVLILCPTDAPNR